MIQLSCPGCDKRLEIDDGFAGGICRCYDCGTLMTVPADATGEAEQLQQVERPARPDRPATPGAPAPEPTEVEAAPQTNTFVTATGREVQISDAQLRRVVVARKPRMGVRIGVVATFVVIAIGLMAFAGYLAMNVLNPSDKQDGPAVTMDNLLFGITNNPYLNRDTNILTTPVDPAVSQSIVVLVDRSQEMGPYLPHVKDILGENLATLGPEIALQVIFVGSSVGPMYPDAPMASFEWDYPAMEAVLAQATAGGASSLAPGITAALAGQPDRIILVVHERPDDWDAVREAVPEGVRVDAVQLGDSSGSLKDWAKSTGGQYAAARDDQLEKWRDQWARVRGHADVPTGQ